MAALSRDGGEQEHRPHTEQRDREDGRCGKRVFRQRFAAYKARLRRAREADGEKEIAQQRRKHALRELEREILPKTDRKKQHGLHGDAEAAEGKKKRARACGCTQREPCLGERL